MKKILLTVIILFAQTIHTSNAKQTDAYYMQAAIEAAKENPSAPFGAVIVDNKTGEILARGVNASAKNPTLHGEIAAINNLAQSHPDVDWKTVTLYTTAEPCSKCQSAIVWAGISRVVFATSIDYLIAHGWHQITIPSAYINSKATFYKGTITGGVLADKTDPLFLHAHS